MAKTILNVDPEVITMTAILVPNIQVKPLQSISRSGTRRHDLQIDGLIQERRNFVANVLVLRFSCTNPSNKL